MENTEKRLCKKGLHDLDADGATYRDRDDRERCRACKNERSRRSRQRRLEREAAAAREAEAAAPPPPVVALPPRVGSPAQQALYRHAVLVRRQRGLL